MGHRPTHAVQDMLQHLEEQLSAGQQLGSDHLKLGGVSVTSGEGTAASGILQSGTGAQLLGARMELTHCRILYYSKYY